MNDFVANGCFIEMWLFFETTADLR